MSSTLSIRFPEDLEKKLDQEARLAHKRRSELVREAVQEYVLRRESERFMQEMVREMQEWQGNATPEHQSDSLNDNLPDDDLDTLVRNEREAGIDPDARWWK